MYKIIIEGSDKTIHASPGQTVHNALTDAGVLLEALCGGKGKCGKCMVQLLAGRVAGPDGTQPSPKAGNCYTACQIRPLGDIVIALRQTAASPKGSMSAIPADDGQPLLRKAAIVPEYPALENCYSLQEMIGHAFEASALGSGAEFMRQLAGAAAEKPDQMTVVTMGDEIIAVEPGDTTAALFGVAFDIGTTTIAGMLVDINKRSVVATHSRTNPQAAFGADVISRIEAAASPGGLEALAASVRRCLNEIVAALCDTADLPRERIYAAVIAGNTTMEHLLMGISPHSLTVKPYAAVFKQIEPFLPEVIDLHINCTGRVLLLPNIASFVGADTTAAIVAVGQDSSSVPTLLVDLGTNGEIVLSNGKRLWACATAAGPAFEGAHIRDGMRAAAGAIADVAIDGDVRIRTIDDGKPAGICGSGIVKAVAELVKNGIITASGRFRQEAQKSLPPAVAGRLRNNAGRWEFVLAAAENSATGCAIAVTQDDIRQLQLVKAAIRSGIEILMEKARPACEPTVFIAGAFGNYIDIDSALKIGLFPGFSRERINSVGNAAGTGAVLALLSREKQARCGRIAAEAEYVELAAQPNFQKMFLANLSFAEVKHEKQ
ncbi:ASKHA domain-containing protein [Anaeroselena agilis]|uniref:ASKHA domain-containing protein n=1 Tax=Anaeroselena agilis TaxID=3063788 RepID=A0ABU3P0J6_9FIRM|nr:ASKHA domain-containing protein [Selenomonadales bacterium 4137-cl]